MKKIFITRNLKANSVFRQKLEAAGFDVHGKSLLQLSAMPFTTFPKTDWIFFYSKNGVKFFFQRLTALGRPIPQKVKWAAIGQGTAQELQAKTQRVDFIGNGDILRTAADFLKMARGLRVLFPQAQQSRQTIQRLLEETIVSNNLIVYKNEMIPQFSVPDANILVFTSPMNAEAYFNKKTLFNDQKVFAIGRTTAKALVSMGIEEFNVAEEPSEEALVKAILELRK